MNRPSLIALLVILLVGACADRVSHTLADADRLLAENPDSALAIVGRIDPEDLSRDDDKALYALLLTEARYKNGIDETDDSLISIATDHYHLQEGNPLRARAYYQKGMVNINAKEYSDALLSLMIAEETAESVKDTLLLALIHRSIGDAFRAIENPKTAITYYQRSYDEFNALNDTVYTADALYDLACAYYNSTNYRECILLLKELLPSVKTKDKTGIIPYSLGLLGDCYEITDNPTEAIIILNKLHNDYPDNMTPRNWNRLGLAYLKLGDLKKARDCEDSLRKISDEQWWLYYRIADASHDYPKALKLLEVEYHDNHDIYMDWISRGSEKGLLDQYALLKATAAKEKREHRIRLVLIAIIVVLVSIIAIILFKRLSGKNVELSRDNQELSKKKDALQIREKELVVQLERNEVTILELKERIRGQEAEIYGLRSKANSLNHEILALQSDISEKDKDIMTLRQQYDELILEQGEQEKSILKVREKLRNAVGTGFDFFDRLLRVYYNSGANDVARKDVSDDFAAILDEMRGNKKLIRELENSVDYYFDNLFKSFRNDYPKLNEYEYELFLFLLLGFSPKAISTLQGIWTETFYNRKSALIRKIKSGTSATKYLEYINVAPKPAT